MNLESRIEIVIIKDNNRFIFSMPLGVGYGQAYDACFEALDQISKMAQDAVQRAQRSEKGEE